METQTQDNSSKDNKAKVDPKEVEKAAKDREKQAKTGQIVTK